MRRLGIAVAVVLLASCGGSDNSGANPSPETGTERTDVSADTDVTADTDATDVTDGAEAAAPEVFRHRDPEPAEFRHA